MEPWLASACRRRPQAPALILPARTLSYTELYAQAAAAADELRSQGLGRGERVAVALPAGNDFAVAVHAAWLIGAVVVPLDSRLTANEREQRSVGALVVAQPLGGTEGVESGAALGSASSGPSSFTGVGFDDPAVVLYTSGTTAAPKPVVLSFRNFLASALGSAVALGLNRRERWLCPMPLIHVGGLSVLVRSAIYASTAVLPGGFDTDRVLATLSDPEAAITLVSLVPTMLSRLLDAGWRAPPTLRWALLGGGPIAPALLERAGAAEVPVATTYGMTEACSQIATDGWPLPGVELRIAPDDEILVRGDTVAQAALDADGWLHTGDLGLLDGDGRLQIIGRKADTIISGGENVAPAEVEAVLLEHPAVADAGVFSRPDPEWGEAVVAAVVSRRGWALTPEALRCHCTERLAAFKVPKAFAFVDVLPRTASGKLLRRRLENV